MATTSGFFWTLALAAFLTAFYTMRQIGLTFLGQARSDGASHAPESVASMTIPLILISIFAIGAGWFGIPSSFPGLGGLVPNWIEQFLEPYMESMHPASAPSGLPFHAAGRIADLWRWAALAPATWSMARD